MNKVHLADCMEIMAGLPDNAYDLAIVDPPYGLTDWNDRGSNKILYDGREHMDLEKIKKWETGFSYAVYFTELFRVTKNQIIWGGNHFLDYLGKTKQIIVWDKCIRGMHFNDCEIAWASNIKEACRIFTLSANQLDRIHPTQKPIALYKWLLQNYAKPGNTIFDSHVGSGSIRIACHDLGFDFEGCEIDADYHAAQEERYKRHAAQGSLFGASEIQRGVFEK